MNSGCVHPLGSDLDDILGHSASVWPHLGGARFFITGGTGFIGTWMVESLLWANFRKSLEIEVTVLTRDPASFFKKVPHLATAKGLRLVTGDIRTFTPPDGTFTHIIHAATAASAQMNLEKPFEMIDTIVNGAARVFEFAGACGARTVLHTSSGGIYGGQPTSLAAVPEDYSGAPNPLDPLAAYSEAKRLAEMMGSIASRKYSFDHKVARITALVGPHLPLDIHFALGNFIRNGLRHEAIRIKGDGTPIRSYLYAADLIAWLWVIMAKGENNRPYNAGSELPVSLLDAAQAVARVQGEGLKIEVAGALMGDGRPNRYVPSTQRAQKELGLSQWTDLDTAIRKTLDWHRAATTR